MRTTAIIAVTLAIGLPAALSAEVAPDDVTFGDMGAVTESLSGAPGDPEAGKKIMVTRGAGNCIACHEVTALKAFPFHGNVGPSLDGVGGRYDEAQLRGIVANAKNMFEGTIMPAFYKTSGFIRPGDAFTGKAATGDLHPLLSAQEIEDVVAYLKTLKE